MDIWALWHFKIGAGYEPDIEDETQSAQGHWLLHNRGEGEGRNPATRTSPASAIGPAASAFSVLRLTWDSWADGFISWDEA